MFPIVLQDASIFAARCEGIPDFFMAGIVKVPVVATFPAPLPERAPMNELAMTAQKAEPPGKRPNTAIITLITESIALVASSILESVRKAIIAKNRLSADVFAMYGNWRTLRSG